MPNCSGVSYRLICTAKKDRRSGNKSGKSESDFPAATNQTETLDNDEKTTMWGTSPTHRPAYCWGCLHQQKKYHWIAKKARDKYTSGATGEGGPSFSRSEFAYQRAGGGYLKIFLLVFFSPPRGWVSTPPPPPGGLKIEAWSVVLFHSQVLLARFHHFLGHKKVNILSSRP